MKKSKRLKLAESQLRKFISRLLESKSLNKNKHRNKILIFENEKLEISPSRQKIVDLISILENVNEIISKYKTHEGADIKLGLGVKKSGDYANIYFAFDHIFPDGYSSYTFINTIHNAYYVIQSELEMPKEIKDELISKIPYGFIQISKKSPTEDREYEKCMGPNGQTPYYVHLTSPTRKGWGPLLYDVAIDYASLEGAGIMSDRTSVSDSARGVWEKYSKRSDVEKHQMDTHAMGNDSSWKRHQITPNDSNDDCSQYITLNSKDKLDWTRLSRSNDEYLNPDELKRKRELEKSWQNSPLSKIYTTNGKTIEYLESNQMIFYHND
jgi:hypothetical protein